MTGSHPSPHLLVTSAGAKLPLLRAAQEAVRRIDPDSRVIAADQNSLVPARYGVEAFWPTPDLESMGVEVLIRSCRDRGIGWVLPTRDGELAFWAGARAAFSEAGIEVIVSDLAGIDLCSDKLAFAQTLVQQGLGAIPAALSPEAFRPCPLVVKERFGAGSINLGLRLGEQAALAHAAGLEAPVFQPFVEGREISIDGWMDRRGRPHGLVLRRRDLVRGGESQITTTFSHAGLEDQARAAFAALHLRGPAVMQAILDEEGEALRIIECNARFGGASTTAIAVGLDLIFWSLIESRTGVAPPFSRSPGQVRQVRWPTDLILHDPDL